MLGNQPELGQRRCGSHSRACGPTRQDHQGPRAGGNMEGQLYKSHWISLTTIGEAVHQMIKKDNTIIVSKCLIKIFSGGYLNTNMMHMQVVYSRLHGSSNERRKYPDISWVLFSWIFFQNMSRTMGWGKAVTSSKPAIMSSMKVDFPYENLQVTTVFCEEHSLISLSNETMKYIWSGI